MPALTAYPDMFPSKHAHLWTGWPVYLVILLIFWVLNLARTAFRPGLRNIPGPFLAKFSRFYITKYVAKGEMHSLFIDLHHKYGPLVRYAPNKVSVADPSAIQTIYGVSSGFVKVRLLGSMTDA